MPANKGIDKVLEARKPLNKSRSSLASWHLRDRAGPVPRAIAAKHVMAKDGLDAEMQEHFSGEGLNALVSARLQWMQEVHLQDVSGRAESGTEAESDAGSQSREAAYSEVPQL